MGEIKKRKLERPSKNIELSARTAAEVFFAWGDRTPYVQFVRKISYPPPGFERKVNVSHRAFMKMKSSIEELLKIMKSSDDLDTKKIYLTEAQYLEVVIFKEEKYLSLAHEKSDGEGGREINTLKTINFNTKEAENLNKVMDIISEVLEKTTTDNEMLYSPPEEQEEDMKIFAYVIRKKRVIQEAQEGEEEDVILGAFAQEKDAELRAGYFNFPVDITREQVQRPMRTAVLANILKKEMERVSISKKIPLTKNIFQLLDRNRLSAILHYTLGSLKYTASYFASELFDAFVYLKGVETMFDDDGNIINENSTDDEMLQRLLCDTYDIVVEYV